MIYSAIQIYIFTPYYRIFELYIKYILYRQDKLLYSFSLFLSSAGDETYDKGQM